MLQQESALRVKCVVSERMYSSGSLALTLCLETLLLQDGHLKSSLQSTGGEAVSLTTSFSTSCVLLLPAAAVGPATGEAAAVTSRVGFFLCRLFSLRKIICIAYTSSKGRAVCFWMSPTTMRRGAAERHSG